MRIRITDQFVKQAAPEGRAAPIFMDAEVIGFGVQIRPSGRRSFTLDYSFERRRRRMFIGDYPDWTVTAAREEAKRLKREIDRGVDPLALREERFEAPTVDELVARYLAEHVVRLTKDSAADVNRMMQVHVIPAWGRRKAADITTADVDRLLAQIATGRARPHKAKTKQKRSKALTGARPTPVRANRVGAAIRKMFNLAIRWKVRPDNPAAAFIRNPEHPRERFLDHKEIERLSNVLAQHDNQRFSHIVRLLLLTGARRGEVLNARWEQFDLESGVWTKPAATTKQRRLHRAPLSGAAVQLLKSVRAGTPADCPWVFPGDVEGKPVHEIKRFWDDVRIKADLPGLRIHDLRHTFASLLVSGGMSLPMIGKLLGHTQVQTTQRYAHLFDDPLRAGLEQVGDLLKPKLRIASINDELQVGSTRSG
jgi:integrase